MHGNQVCVPDATLLPVGIGRLYPAAGRMAAAGRLRGGEEAAPVPGRDEGRHVLRVSGDDRISGTGPSPAGVEPVPGREPRDLRLRQELEADVIGDTTSEGRQLPEEPVGAGVVGVDERVAVRRPRLDDIDRRPRKLG